MFFIGVVRVGDYGRCIFSHPLISTAWSLLKFPFIGEKDV